MRSVAVVVPLLLVSCGAKYRPADPVMSGYERSFKFPVERPFDNLVYSGRQAGTGAPMVPLLAFGAAFDLDFVVMPKDGEFDMIEVAKLSTPSGPVWVALETAAGSGDQTLIANLDDLPALMPEIPLTRQTGDLVATDRSTENTVDVSVTWTNSRGQKVEATLTGDPPVKLNKHRNGQTFNHSANQLMAVLDIPSTESLFTADVAIDGNNLKFEKIAGLVPGQFVMQQVQGGLVSGAFKIVPGDLAAGGPDLSKVVVNTPGAEPTVKPPPEMLLKMAVAQSASGVAKCWKDRAAADADLKGGRMAFSFTVTGGAVSDVKAAELTGDDVFVDAELATCASTAIAGWKLDPTITGAVTWDFTFVPGDVEAGTEPETKLGQGESKLEAAAAPAEVAENGAAPADGTATDAAAEPAEPADGLTDGEGTEGEGTEGEGTDGAAADPMAEDPAIHSFTTVHTNPTGSTELKWLVTRQGDRVTAKQTTSLRTLTYNYRLVQGTFLELYSITVEQYGRGTPTTAITFNPPMPDLRWAFSGKRASTFIVDVNGQQNYAYGEAESYWTEGGPKVKVTGTAPEWVKVRPLLTTITYAPDGTADVKIERVGE